VCPFPLKTVRRVNTIKTQTDPIILISKNKMVVTFPQYQDTNILDIFWHNLYASVILHSTTIKATLNSVKPTLCGIFIHCQRETVGKISCIYQKITVCHYFNRGGDLKDKQKISKKKFFPKSKAYPVCLRIHIVVLFMQ